MNLKIKYFLICLSAILWNMHTQAQLEKVFIETYYVSDANDATDITGGGVEEGSITYRIYVDLLPGSQLVEIFGDADHPFEIMSTDTFTTIRKRPHLEMKFQKSHMNPIQLL